MRAKTPSERVDSAQQLLMVLWLVVANLFYYRQLAEPIASYLRHLVSEGL